MPRTIRLARAVGLALALSAACGPAMAQAPQPKGQPRRPAPAPNDAADAEEMPARPKSAKAADAPDAKKDAAEKGKKDTPPKENPAVARLRDALSGGMFGQAISPTAVLLPEPAVKKELKLDAKQTTKIDEVNKALGEQRREAFQGARANGIFDPEAIAATMAEVQQEGDATINRLLTAAQRKRLNQIALQIMGPLSITSVDIATKLNMSEAQQAAVEQIIEDRKLASEEARSAHREMMMVSRNPDATDKTTRNLMLAEASTAARKAEKAGELATLKLTKLLTKKQRAALDKMMGEPFDLSKLEGTFGGRGGRGPRGGWPGGPGGGPGGPGGPGDPGNAGPQRKAGPPDKAVMEDETDPAPARPAKPKAAKGKAAAEPAPAMDNADAPEGDDAEMPAKPARPKSTKGRAARGAAPQEN